MIRSKHIRIKFDYKNYYCKKHFNKFLKYDFKCKQNLCEECVKEHAGHDIKNYDSMAPTNEELAHLKNSLEKMEKNITTLKLVIEDITYNLNGTMRIFQSYCDITKSIIEKYEMFNKGTKKYINFTMLKTLRNLKFSNEQIMEDLISIIKEKNIFDKTIS